MAYSGMNKMSAFGRVPMPRGYQGGTGIGDGIIERKQMEVGRGTLDPAKIGKQSFIDKAMKDPDLMKNIASSLAKGFEEEEFTAPAPMQLSQPNPQAMPRTMMGAQPNGDYMGRLRQLMAARGLSGIPNQRR